MKNSDVPQEKISALADGELGPSELEAVFASLRKPEVRKEWDLYHQIGDALRSEDMASDLSPDFAARMAARLDAEPTIFAPAAQVWKNAAGVKCSKTEAVKRFAMPGIAAVLAAFTAYLVAPQLMTGGTTKPAETYASSSLASASAQATLPAASVPAIAPSVSASAEADLSDDADQDAVVLRDPNIDEYLVAHQRYSPSLYDTTQFVRSATFENEPQK
jgi:sigma-E factor negative regulatory protein RseA